MMDFPLLIRTLIVLQYLLVINTNAISSPAVITEISTFQATTIEPTLMISSTVTSSTKNDNNLDEIRAVDDDVIELNIGGQKMTTLRSTLTFLGTSKLARMFRDETSEKNLLKDKDGAIFFDYNPIHFNYLLDQLRALKRAPKKPAHQIQFQSPYISSQTNFTHMLMDFGLMPNDFLFPVEGAHVNLTLKSLTGWQECHRSSYKSPFDFSILKRSCNGTQLLLGCRSLETPDLLTLAGIGQFDDIFQPCLPKQCSNNRKSSKKLKKSNCTNSFQCITKAKRGVGWYNANNQTLGFVRGSLSFTVSPCDSSELDADYRLCWTSQSQSKNQHTDRCGKAVNLHNSSKWERLIYSMA